MELRQRLLLNSFQAVIVVACVAARTVYAATSAALPELGRLQSAGAAVSAVVWDLDSGKPIAELDPATQLTPASLSKIFVAAAALDTFAPDTTFVTELHAATLPRNGTLEGDLVLRGSGDATLDEQGLWSLGAQLRSMGVRNIAGRLLVERAPFGELECATIDRCAAQQGSNRAFNAVPSAIGVNYGSWCLAIRPTRPGQPALLRSCGVGQLPIPLQGQVMTTVVNTGQNLQVERSTSGDGDRLVVGGSIAAGPEAQVHRAMSDPATATGLLLQSVLTQLGITVSGKTEAVAGTVATASQLLASTEGLQLQEQVGRMMRYSNNYIADVLTMDIALKRGMAPRTLAEAAQLLVPKDISITPGSATPALLASGSGLTTESRVSARNLVDVLTHAFRDARHFPVFYGSLVVPADAPFAFLQGGNADWQQRVALKSGTLSSPYPVLGLAGYLRKKSGGWMAFAAIINGTPRLRELPTERSLRALRTDLESILETY
ncbi:MAG: D-alanyl-D-alanine carboxypeptidase/D-alanyl-D-alanine-endopeptidase [Pseudomonadota bacterium]